mmetsp:Transcript_18358/g.13362  ORF Transcript_18358/g.13362 Transcript_18358/m.13362 type:complete len:103 (+) Transcript_18358:667-975(+)
MMSTLTPMVERQLHKKFALKHLQQMLWIAPNFFIHKWELKKGKQELLIDIPANIKLILEMYFKQEAVEPTAAPVQGLVPNEVLLRRSAVFKSSLLMLTMQHF